MDGAPNRDRLLAHRAVLAFDPDHFVVVSNIFTAPSST
jgi:hypothetical protein